MTDETASLDTMLDDASSSAPAAETQAPQTTPETPTPATPETPQAQPRDDTGRFTPKVEAAPVTAAPAAQPTPQAEKQVPTPDQFKGYLDEREKRQSIEKELRELRERFEQQNARPIPDFNSDPEGFATRLRDENQKVALNTRFETSELVAQKDYGDETVKAAMDWGMAQANASQAFASEYVQQRHPVDWIVKRFKRDQILAQIGDDPDAFVRKRFAELSASPATPQTPQASQPVPQSTPSAPLPTPSLAAAVSAGGASAVPDGAASLDALLKD